MSGFWSDTTAWLLDPSALQAIASTGRLRAGIAVGSARSAVWATRNGKGRPQGVTVDIATAFAETIGLPLEIVTFDSSGAVIAAAKDRAWDVAFAPVDETRKSLIAFGPNYYFGESTLMAAAASGMETLDDGDKTGVRIAGVEETATIRSARGRFAKAEVIGVESLDEALDLFRTSSVDALALGRESLRSLLPRFPTARILEKAFHATGTAIAVPIGAVAALEIFSSAIEEMKVDGSIRAIFDRNGMKEAAVAPVGSRS